MEQVTETRTGEREITAGPKEIDDQDQFVLSPLFRLRNDKKGVLLQGWNGAGTYHLHHSVGIVVTLCDGERSVGEIARLTEPFVPDANGEDRSAKALKHVKNIIQWYRQTVAEQRGERAAKGNGLPQAALVPPEQLPAFGRLSRAEYDPMAFLPDRAPTRTTQGCPLTREDVPTTINWHLTSACSTDCRYCYLGRRSVQPLPWKRTVELIHEASEIGVMEINAGGGDVILYPHLLEVLALLRDLKFMPVQLATKSYVSKELAKALAEMDNLYELQFSIDSAVEDVADFMVRKPGFCKAAMESIENALAAGLRLATKSVVTPYNVLTIPDTYRRFRDMGVTTVRLASYCRSGFHHTDDLYNTEESFPWLQAEVAKLRDEYPDDQINVQNGGPQLKPANDMDPEAKKKRWEKRNRCTAGRSAMMICSDGKVIPCEQMPESESTFVGDLARQSILDVWNGNAFKELTWKMPQERFKGTVCHDCDEQAQCHDQMGLCIRDNCILYGTPYVPSTICPKAEVPFVRQY